MADVQYTLHLFGDATSHCLKNSINLLQLGHLAILGPLASQEGITSVDPSYGGRCS